MFLFGIQQREVFVYLLLFLAVISSSCGGVENPAEKQFPVEKAISSNVKESIVTTPDVSDAGSQTSESENPIQRQDDAMDGCDMDAVISGLMTPGDEMHEFACMNKVYFGRHLYQDRITKEILARILHGPQGDLSMGVVSRLIKSKPEYATDLVLEEVVVLIKNVKNSELQIDRKIEYCLALLESLHGNGVVKSYEVPVLVGLLDYLARRGMGERAVKLLEDVTGQKTDIEDIEEYLSSVSWPRKGSELKKTILAWVTWWKKQPVDSEQEKWELWWEGYKRRNVWVAKLK